MLTLLIVDFSQTSYWAAATKPLGEAQRWITVTVQAAYVAANVTRWRRIAVSHLPLLGLIALCASSSLWSVDPGTSLLGATRLLLLALAILLAQDRQGGDRVAQVFLAVCGLLVWANLLSLAVPRLSIMSGSLAGAFRGLTDHKNTLGQLCGLTLALLLAALAGPRTRPRVYALLLTGLALAACVALSRSATAAVLCGTAAGLFAIGLTLRATGLPILVGTAALAAVAVLAGLRASGHVDILSLLGRDATLTGRAEIWAFVDLYVQQRPWLGFGYRAFPLSELLRADPRWGLESYVVGSTHNAYLAVVTELGRVGLCAYLAWLTLFVTRAFPAKRAEDRLRATMVLGVYLVSGLSESFAGISPGLYFAALLVAFPSRPRLRSLQPAGFPPTDTLSIRRTAFLNGSSTDRIDR
jgi:O-antigen ligase